MTAVVATVTSSSTKADILAAYNELCATHNKFREGVVRKTQNLAKRHGWCEVANRGLVSMGLADLMPNEFFVEVKLTKDDSWEYETDLISLSNAIAYAKNMRNSSIQSQRRNFDYDNNRQSERISVVVGGSVNIEAVIASVKTEHAKRNSENIPEFVPSQYPMYRAVERTADTKIVSVQVITDDDL